MKTLYISLAWLLCIIILWFFVYNFILDNSIKYFFDELDILYDNIIKENYNEAKPIIDKINERWEKTEKIWIYCVNQSEVENIKASINKIENYIKIENQTMALLEIEEFKKFLSLVKGNESLSLENIF